MALSKDHLDVLTVILTSKAQEQQNKGIHPMTFCASLLLTPDSERLPLIATWLGEVENEVTAAIGTLDFNRIQAEKKLKAKRTAIEYLKTLAAPAAPEAPAEPTPETPTEPVAT